MAASLARGTTVHRERRVRAARAGPVPLPRRDGRARSRASAPTSCTIHGQAKLGGGELHDPARPHRGRLVRRPRRGHRRRAHHRERAATISQLRPCSWASAARRRDASSRATTLRVPPEQRLHVQDDLGGHITKLEDGPWPDFPADLTSIAVAIATQAHRHRDDLREDVRDAPGLHRQARRDGRAHRAVRPAPRVISGPARLRGKRMESPDIRAGMALLHRARSAPTGTSVDPERAARSTAATSASTSACARSAPTSSGRIAGMRDETVVVRAGLPPASREAPFFRAGVRRAVPRRRRSGIGPLHLRTFHNPTWSAYEAALGELVGWHALVFAWHGGDTPSSRLLLPGDVDRVAGEKLLARRGCWPGEYSRRWASRRAVPIGRLRFEPCQRRELVCSNPADQPALDVCDIEAAAAAGMPPARSWPWIRNDGNPPRPAARSASAPSLLWRPRTESITVTAISTSGHLALGSRPGPIGSHLAHPDRLHRGPFEVWPRIARSPPLAPDALRAFSAKRPGSHRRVPVPPPRDRAGQLFRSRRRPFARIARGVEMRRGMGPSSPPVAGRSAGAGTILAASVCSRQATSFGAGIRPRNGGRGGAGRRAGEGFIRLSAGCRNIDDLCDDLDRGPRRIRARPARHRPSRAGSLYEVPGGKTAPASSTGISGRADSAGVPFDLGLWNTLAGGRYDVALARLSEAHCREFRPRCSATGCTASRS